MKEIRVEARLRNNRLYHAIFTEYGSVSAFCRVFNFKQNAVGDLLNLKSSPFRRGRKAAAELLCRDFTLRVATALRETPEYLFPADIYKMVKVETAVEVGLNEIPAGREPFVLPQGEINIERRELKAGIEQALSALTPREQRVIELRIYDGKTYDVIGKELGVTKARIRQIEFKALRRLSHPKRGLYEFAKE